MDKIQSWPWLICFRPRLRGTNLKHGNRLDRLFELYIQVSVPDYGELILNDHVGEVADYVTVSFRPRLRGTNLKLPHY